MIFAARGRWDDATQAFDDSVASPSLRFERLTLDGGYDPDGSVAGNASALALPAPPSVQPVPPYNPPPILPHSGPANSFQDGLLVIEDCLIENFWAGYPSPAGGPSSDAAINAKVMAAVQIGASVYLCLIRNCVFSNNYRALTLENSSDARIADNLFLQGSNGGPSITLGGPDVIVSGNFFTRHTIEDGSTAPDILLQPGGGFDAQFVIIENNKFGPENENLSATRVRILAGFETPPAFWKAGQTYSADAVVAFNGVFYTATANTIGVPGNVNSDWAPTACGPTIIRGNLFAIEPIDIDSISVNVYPVPPIGGASGSVATIATPEATGAEPGSAVIIVANDPKINGTYQVIESNPLMLATPGGAKATYRRGGFVSTAGNHPSWGSAARSAAIRLQCPIQLWDITGNVFYNYLLLIDDVIDAVQAPPIAGYDQSLFHDNRVMVFPRAGVDYLAPEVFSNGGGQFSTVE